MRYIPHAYCRFFLNHNEASVFEKIGSLFLLMQFTEDKDDVFLLEFCIELLYLLCEFNACKSKRTKEINQIQ